MNSFVVKSVFAAAFVIAPLAARPLESASVFPAPVSLMNLSPSFAGYPGDMTLIAPRAGQVKQSTQGVLTLKRSEDSAKRQAGTLTRANAVNFRFDAHMDSNAALVAPQAGTISFKKDSSDWSFKFQKPN